MAKMLDSISRCGSNRVSSSGRTRGFNPRNIGSNPFTRSKTQWTNWQVGSLQSSSSRIVAGLRLRRVEESGYLVRLII